MLKQAKRHIKQSLVPTQDNGFVPYLLRESAVWAMLGIGLAMFAFIQLARVTGYFGLTAEVYPAVVVSLTNKERLANNLTELSVNQTLQNAAQLKANDMVNKGYFAHTSPEGTTPWYWFNKAGYSFIYAGENLAINYTESETVQKAWLNSPTHRANIMNRNFTEMGVATATGIYNGVKTTFVVEMFGQPAIAKVASASATTPTQPSAGVTSPVVPVKPKATPTTTPTSVSSPVVAGQESSPVISILEETPDFVMVQNNDQTLQPSEVTLTPIENIPWIKRFILQSGTLAAILIQVIIIIAIITTAGMIAREYEKKHKKHMAYGALLVVIMFASLFVGKIGFFDTQGTTATAPIINK